MRSSPYIARGKTPLFINRNFALIWVGSMVSRLGDYLFDTTLVLWIAKSLAPGQPWAPLAVSGIFIAASIPVFAIGPIAGVFVDRWANTRQVMLRMDAARAVLILLLLLATGMASLPGMGQGSFFLFWQLGVIYGVVFLVSIFSQFFNPAGSILFYDTVEEAYRARAAGLFQLILSFAAMAGPPLATALFFISGVQWALLLNALSFVISFLCLLALRVSQHTTSQSKEQESFLRQFREGIHFYVTNAVLMTILIAGMLIFLWASAFQVLGVFFVSQNLHTSTSLFGFLGTAEGVGIAAGAVFASAFASRLGVTRLFWSSMVVMGALVMIYARLTQFLLALLVIFLISFFVAIINVSVNPIALHVTPRELIGRIGSVLTPVMTLASMLSVLLIGWLDSIVLRNFHAVILGVTFGPIDSIFLAAGCIAIAGGFYAMVNMRGVRLAKEDAAEH